MRSVVPAKAGDPYSAAYPITRRRQTPSISNRHRWLRVPAFAGLRRDDGDRVLPHHDRAAGLLPGVDAAFDMGGVGKTRAPGGSHRHRRAFTEGAEEHHAAS